MYQLKRIPEDFRVTEISNVKIKDLGKYIYFTLAKRERDTLEAVKKIAQALNITEKQLGFAGSKDRNAITTQVCSVIGVSKERLLSVKIKDVAIEFLGYGDAPISLGDLEGNKFEIVVRNLDEAKPQNLLQRYIPNYFDEQRFSKHNVEIGKYILKKEFKPAAKLIDDKECSKHLQGKPNDAVGALKKLPIRLLRIYLNSYQSYLWNETLGRYLKKKGKILSEVKYSLGKFIFVEEPEQFIKLKVPIIGFGSEDLAAGKEIKMFINELMAEEKLNYSDFVIKQIPELTLEGELRAAFVEVKDLQFGKPQEDELNSGRKKLRLSFFLSKGSYATMAVKGMFG